MKPQILNLDAMSGESWFKPPIPVSRSAMSREPLASADGFSAAGLLCGGVLADAMVHGVRVPQRFLIGQYRAGRYSETEWDALIERDAINIG